MKRIKHILDMTQENYPIDGYHMDEFGVIHQTNPYPITYDKEYLSYYEGLNERTIKLGHLRAGLTHGRFKGQIRDVLEIGYGTGSYLDAMRLSGVEGCFGTDIANYPLPEGCGFLEFDKAIDSKWDVVAMFDVLEHIPDLSFLSRLDTKMLIISVPYCRFGHYRTSGGQYDEKWFKDWRMLLPNEHLHHFDKVSLHRFMKSYGFDCVHTSHIEDGLRLRDGEEGPNVLTVIFKKNKNKVDKPFL